MSKQEFRLPRFIGWRARLRYRLRFGRVTEADCERCDRCGRLIYPGTTVADSGRRDRGGRPYVHNTFDCSLPGAFVGTWGKGELIPGSDPA